MTRNVIFLPGLLGTLAFFVMGIATLSHYGIDWDTINHLPRGQAYVHFFLTGKTSYANLPEFKEYQQKADTIFFSPSQPKNEVPRRSLYQQDSDDGNRFLKRDGGHPPLSDELSSLFNIVFFQKLGLINDIDSYHIYIVFVASLLLAVLTFWVQKNYGAFAAIVTFLSLTLYPLFLGESRFNLKDISETTFYSFTLLSFFEGITQKKKSLLFLSSVCFGLALGTKFNVLFVIFTIIPWLFLYLFSQKQLKSHIVLFPSLILYPIIGFAIFFASWPFLWKSPIENIGKVVTYYKTIGINTQFDPAFIHFGFNTYAITWIIYSTPLIILFFTAIGSVYAIRFGWQEKHKTSLFVLLWLLVPILRVTMPNAGIYGGVRQIMEFIPAMAILSGLGAKYLVTWLHGYMVKRFKLINHTTIPAMQLFVILLFLPITVKLISIHPNENVYFNPLIGGLKGAQEKNLPYWGNSFGNVYRQGVLWINENVERGAKLVYAQELMTNIPKIFLREDIAFHNTHRSGYLREGEYVIGLVFGDKQNRSYYSSQYYEKSLIPLYQVKVDDTAILSIWKNDVQHLKPGLSKEQKQEISDFTKTGRGIFIDLKKAVHLSRIEATFREQNCQPLERAFFEISLNSKDWIRTPHTLPTDFPIPLLGTQPIDGKLVYPFAPDPARYVFMNIHPKDACLKNISQLWVFYLPDAESH